MNFSENSLGYSFSYQINGYSNTPSSITNLYFKTIPRGVYRLDISINFSVFNFNSYPNNIELYFYISNSATTSLNQVPYDLGYQEFHIRNANYLCSFFRSITLKSIDVNETFYLNVYTPTANGKINISTNSFISYVRIA